MSWLDHCPNVVVDARAAGCHVVCSSSGGTHEIAGSNCTVVEEDRWDFNPVKLYEPPKMDFSKQSNNGKDLSSVDINTVSKKYESVFKSLLGFS